MNAIKLASSTVVRDGDSRALRLSAEDWFRIGDETGWAWEVLAGLGKNAGVVAAGDDGWPKKLKKGRFTSYCKSQGFDGPCKACAEKAMQSDDESVRGMASFYVNTVKP